MKKYIRSSTTKNLDTIAKKTKRIKSTDRSTWISLYYSISDKAAYTEDGVGRYFVTNLINENSPKDIQDAISRWLSM